MPTSKGLSHSTYSLPRSACTIGDLRRSPSAKSSSCAPAHPEPHRIVILPSPFSIAASRSRSCLSGTTTGRLGSRLATLGGDASAVACNATSPGIHHRDPAPADRLADRDLEHAWHLVCSGDQLAVVAALAKEVLRMGLLKVAGADFGRRDLRGDGEHRHARSVAVEQPIDQVQIAWSATARANSELARQMRFGPGGK